MTTPERTLELAEYLADNAILSDAGHARISMLTVDMCKIEVILRHYAEIMQAEPVAFRNPESTSEDYAFSFWPSPSYCVPLIIKPAP